MAKPSMLTPMPSVWQKVLSGTSAWRSGVDKAWDFKRNLSYGAAGAFADVAAGTRYELTSAGAYTSFGANVIARTDLGLQVVPTRTNLALQSQAFDNAVYTKSGGTITADQTTAPDGTSTADKFVPDTGTGVKQLYQTAGFAVAAGTYTMGIYYKPAGYTKVMIWEGGLTGGYVAFDCTGSGSIIASGNGPPVGSIEAIGSGWYKLSIAAIAGGVGTFQPVNYILSPGYVSGDPNTGNNWAGDGVQGGYFWQEQNELGLFSTPPIPTTAGTVTLTGDRVTVADTGATGACEITVDVKGIADGYLWQINDGTANNLIGIRISSGHYWFTIVNATVTQADLDLGVATTGVKSFAAVWGANYAMGQLVGGTPPSADVTVSLPTVTTMAIGGRGFDATVNSLTISKAMGRTAVATANAASFALSLGRATAQASTFQ